MIWLIGTGGMAVDYAKVLEAQHQEFIAIGRGEASAKIFEEKTAQQAVQGGLDSYLKTASKMPASAIVSVGVEQLYCTTMQLIEFGVKFILVEKPGGMSTSELESLTLAAKNNNVKVFIAYNRRFYSSVLKAKKLIEMDGGVTSFNFELTEWGHVIETIDKDKNVLAKWFLSNSTHVADLAFYLGGKPKEVSCFTSGTLDWHPTSARFAGAGVAANNVLFNYGADWESAGRWSVEILTKKYRYILRPMEMLVSQKKGTIQQEIVEIDDNLDKRFKPGLFKQVEAFINVYTEKTQLVTGLCSLDEQCQMLPIYERMAKYH